MTHHHVHGDSHDHKDPNDQFRIQPIEDKGTGTMPSQLTSGNSLTGQPPVVTQPGPVILGEPNSLDGTKVESSEELDQRAAALNQPQPKKPVN